MRILQQLRAENDANGNPRRLWVYYDHSENVFQIPTEVIEEGYGGKPRKEDAIEIMPVDIPTKEYNHIKKHSKKLGIYKAD